MAIFFIHTYTLLLRIISLYVFKQLHFNALLLRFRLLYSARFPANRSDPSGPQKYNTRNV